MKTSIVLCAAAILATPFVMADEEASTGAVTVQYMGASGGMKLFPNGKSSDYIMVQQDKLEEIQPDGKATSNKLNVAGQNSWTPLVANNISGTAVDYTTTFEKKSGDVSFKLVTHLTTEDITTQDIVPCSGCFAINATANSTGLETAGECLNDLDDSCAPLNKDGACNTGYTACTVNITARKDTLKFSIMVSGWEFKSMGNKLAYGLSIKSKSGGAEAKMKNTTKGSNGKKEDKEVELDGGFIVMPSTDLVSGGDNNTVREVKIELSAGTKTTIDFEFDSFEKAETLYYDPDIGASTPTSAPTVTPTASPTSFSGAATVSPLAAALMTLVALPAVLLAH